MKKFFILIVCMIIAGSISAVVSAAGETVVVTSFAGDVKITPREQTEPVECAPNMRIKEGTRIVTGAESYVELAFNRSRTNVVKVDRDSDVIIKLDGNDKIELIEGQVVALMKGLKKGEIFRIRTPDAVCGARGTGWLTGAMNGATNVGVFDNKVFVRGLNRDGSVKEQEFWVNKGFERRVNRFEDPGKSEKMSEQRMQSLRDSIKLPGGGQSRFTDRIRAQGMSTEMREKRIESIQDKKDERRLDQIREDRQRKEDSSSTGGSSGILTKG